MSISVRIYLCDHAMTGGRRGTADLQQDGSWVDERDGHRTIHPNLAALALAMRTHPPIAGDPARVEEYVRTHKYLSFHIDDEQGGRANIGKINERPSGLWEAKIEESFEHIGHAFDWCLTKGA